MKTLRTSVPRGWVIRTGKWEGDTLVVDTKGFNGKTWLDQSGKQTSYGCPARHRVSPGGNPPGRAELNVRTYELKV